jgi:hypothetical protein
MMLLKQYDDRIEPDEDSYETPPKLYAKLCGMYGIKPKLDAAATEQNKLCLNHLSDALHQEWLVDGQAVDTWCNPPHSLNEEFVRRADSQHKKYNMNIMMILPTNTQSAKFYHELIEDATVTRTENHPILGRPVFRKNGKPTPNASRNAYRVIIWRRK